jgi:hypothetical protein
MQPLYASEFKAPVPFCRSMLLRAQMQHRFAEHHIGLQSTSAPQMLYALDMHACMHACRLLEMYGDKGSLKVCGNATVRAKAPHSATVVL